MKIFDFFKRNKEERKDMESSLPDGNEGEDITPSIDPDKPNNSDLDSKSLWEKLKEIADDSTEYEISHGAMCYCPAVSNEKEISCKCSECGREIGNFYVSSYRKLVETAGQIKKTGLAEIKIVCIDCLYEMCKSGLYEFDIKDWNNYNALLSNYKLSNVSIPEDDDKLADILLEKERQKVHEFRNRILTKEEKEYHRLLNIRPTEGEYLIFLFKSADMEKPRLTITWSHDLKYFLAFVKNERQWKNERDATVLLRDNIDVIERLTGLKL